MPFLTYVSDSGPKKFREVFPNDVKHHVPFSMENLRLDDDVLNIPLFLVDHSSRSISLALMRVQQDRI